MAFHWWSAYCFASMGWFHLLQNMCSRTSSYGQDYDWPMPSVVQSTSSYGQDDAFPLPKVLPALGRTMHGTSPPFAQSMSLWGCYCSLITLSVDPFHLDFRACTMDWRVKSAGSRGEHVSWVAGRSHSCISLVLAVVKTSHFTATRWAQKITAV